jgi:hypothetical protein
MVRNNTSFWLHYSAYNASSNEAELNDSANHTLKLFIDGVLSDPTNTPEDIGNGECRLLVTAAESSGAKFICVAGTSSTSDVYIIPGMVITDLLVPGTAFVGCYTAWDSLNNVPATGDVDSGGVPNHTLAVAQGNTSAGATNTPAEISAVAVPGLYSLSVTTAEANGTAVSIIGSSSTSDVNIIPTELAPFDVDYPAQGDVRKDTDYAEGTLTGTLVVTTVAQPLEIIEIETTEVIEL